uniref:Major facilitator superfamily (MFS) profile domain-containing protein n=1 Tax=Trichuris muris TaxID=70415 RepID=A0A5S6Q916_TRIMR
MDRRQKLFLYVCLVSGIWHIGLQWTNLLFPFLEWEVQPPLAMVDIGVIHTLGNIWNTLGAFLIGLLIDVYGLKICLIASTISTSLYYFCIANCKGYWSFVFAQTFRLGFHFDHLTEIFVSTITRDGERTADLLKLSMPVGASLMIGPFLAGKMTVLYDIRTAQVFNSIFTLASILPTVIYLLPETHKLSPAQTAKLKLHQYWQMAHNDRLVKCIGLKALLTASVICYEIVTWQHIVRRHSETPGDATLLFCILGSAILFMNFYGIRKLKQHFDPTTLVKIALACLVACYALLTVVSSYVLTISLMILQTVSNGVATAEVMAQMIGTVERSHLGKATGLARASQWMLQCTIPLVGGYVIQKWSYSVLCILAAAFASLALVEIARYDSFLNTGLDELPWLLHN